MLVAGSDPAQAKFAQSSSAKKFPPNSLHFLSILLTGPRLDFCLGRLKLGVQVTLTQRGATNKLSGHVGMFLPDVTGVEKCSKFGIIT